MHPFCTDSNRQVEYDGIEVPMAPSLTAGDTAHTDSALLRVTNDIFMIYALLVQLHGWRCHQRSLQCLLLHTLSLHRRSSSDVKRNGYLEMSDLSTSPPRAAKERCRSRSDHKVILGEKRHFGSYNRTTFSSLELCPE